MKTPLQFLSILFLFGILIPAHGQQSETIQTEALSVQIKSEGSLFNSSNLDAGLTTVEGNPLIYAANLWYMTRDANGNLRGAVEDFGTNEIMHASGTINTDSDQASSPITRVSAVEINVHQEQFSNPNYVMPIGIAEWPGNGNTAIGEMEQMAPYVDLNENGIYEPDLGEYPDIIGDHSIYLIKNDGATRFGAPLGIEEHYMISLFNENHEASEVLGNSVMLTFTLHHRGSEVVDPIQVGMFLDGDLGNASDDYMGTSEAANAVVFYNGDENDDQFGGTGAGFGVAPPGLAVGSMFCDLWGSMPVSLNFPQAVASDYFNLLNARWIDGNCLINKGNGHPNSYAGDDAKNTRFVYNGTIDSDSEWTESNEDQFAGDRRLLAILQPKELAPGGSITYSMVAHLARDTAISHLENANLSLAEIGVVESDLLGAYENHPLVNASLSCETAEVDPQCTTVGVNELEAKLLKIFPNPTTGPLAINLKKPAIHVAVLNAAGKMVSEWLNPEANLKIHLSPGQYLLRVVFEDGTQNSEKVFVH